MNGEIQTFLVQSSQRGLSEAKGLQPRRWGGRLRATGSTQEELLSVRPVLGEPHPLQSSDSQLISSMGRDELGSQTLRLSSRHTPPSSLPPQRCAFPQRRPLAPAAAQKLWTQRQAIHSREPTHHTPSREEGGDRKRCPSERPDLHGEHQPEPPRKAAILQTSEQ